MSKWVFAGSLLVIFAVAFLLRFHNVFAYNTYWADDGGGHLAYVQTLVDYHRLPTPEETYLAWHEPAFYILAAIWAKAGMVLGVDSIDWREGLQVIISLFSIAIIARLAWVVSGKNRAVTFLTTTFLSFLFVSVKLGAYVNNELLAQTFILGAVLLFWEWRLGTAPTKRHVIFWALILGFATLTKITAIIVLVTAVGAWGMQYVRTKERIFWQAALMLTLIVGFMNLPWFWYKQTHFGQSFSINLAEEKPRQSLVTSPGWGMIFRINPSVVVNYPYWFSGPHAAPSIILADTFGDYYNLFNPVDAINLLPEGERVLVQNGRYTTPALFQTMLSANRLGAIISLISAVGFAGALMNRFRRNGMNGENVFLFLCLLGGVSALMYNFLRLPYPERGTLKIHFVYFILPIIFSLSTTWWFERIRQKAVAWAVVGLPILVYIIIIWPLLWV